MAASSQGTGVHGFWGFSAAIDLQDAPAQPGADPPEVDAGAPLHILTCGEGDIRNMFRTICQLRRHPSRQLEFFVLENRPEHIARQLLLFHIALDESMPLREREQLFLEIYGNCFLRAKSAEYIDALVPELIKLVTSGGSKWQELLRVDSMKHKSRDDLEDVFKSWRSSVPFDVEKYRDERLRKMYGLRYDARQNVLDWDYHMRLVKMASIIHPHEYRAWRQVGNAFTIRDRVVNLPGAVIPNRTLSSYAEGSQKGRGSHMRRGYWGDIVNSPYIAFGVEANDHTLFKVCGSRAPRAPQRSAAA
jgi:dynein assembly factor 3